MDPLELIAKLAALVPPPYLNLIRFYGILAPKAKHRRLVAPRPSESTTNEYPSLLGQHKYKPPWSYLLNRVFGIDLELCPNCKKSKLRIIAAILDYQVIRKILLHLDLPADIPQAWPARAPPFETSEFSQLSFEDSGS